MSDATAAESDAAKDKQEPAKKKGGSKLLIIIAAAVLVLGAGGGGAWFFMSKDHADEASADSGEAGAHDAKDAKDSKKEKGKKGKKAKAAEPKLPAIYVDFQPPFVVNFDAKGVMRFLQVSVQVLTRDHETSELIKQNEPKVRNDMLMLLGAQTLDTISTTQAKEALRKQALGTIVKIVDDEGGEGKKVEDLYFTSFVMQ